MEAPEPVLDPAGLLLKLNVVIELVLDGGIGPFRLGVLAVVDGESVVVGVVMVGWSRASGLVRVVGVPHDVPLMDASALFMSS